MNRSPLNRITPEDHARFAEDGVVCLRAMFDRDWIERMLTAVDRAKNAQHPLARKRDITQELGGTSGLYHMNTFVWCWDDDFRAWALESPCAEVAAELMHADEVRLFYDQVFVKEPNTAERTDWHQDLPFWPMRGNDILSVWVALTPVTRKNSGLEYVAGSHRWGKFYAAVFPDQGPAFRSTLEPCPDFSVWRGDESLRFLSWEMEAGDCLVHHPLTVHGSGGNLSPLERRVAISNRYLGPDARWDPRPGTVRITGDPQITPGAPPHDDRCFPVAWRRPRSMG